MLEALWGVEFESRENHEALGFGYDVAVLEANRMLGGDSSFVYTGSYEVKNNKVHAKVKCTNDRGVLESVFGDLREFNLDLTGDFDRNEFTISGSMAEDRSKLIVINLTRRAELPP